MCIKNFSSCLQQQAHQQGHQNISRYQEATPHPGHTNSTILQSDLHYTKLEHLYKTNSRTQNIHIYFLF